MPSSDWWNPGWGTTGDGIMNQASAQMDPSPQPVMNFRFGGNPDPFYDARDVERLYFAPPW